MRTAADVGFGLARRSSSGSAFTVGPGSPIVTSFDSGVGMISTPRAVARAAGGLIHTARVVKGYIHARLTKGAAPATVKNEVGVLGRAFTLACRSGHMPHRPYLPSPRVSNARTGFFTDAEVRTLP